MEDRVRPCGTTPRSSACLVPAPWGWRAAALLLAGLVLFSGAGMGAGHDQPAAQRPLFVAGLDSLSGATLGRALEYLEAEPAELGFDKLYAEDDTFRLGIVERLLGDPLAVPGWQARTVGRIREELRDSPAGLPVLLGELAEAPIGPAGKSVTGVTVTSSNRPVFGEASPAARGRFGGAIDRFLASAREAEILLEDAFAEFSAEERTRLITLAPAFWGEEDHPHDRAKKGRLHFEQGIAVDTTLEFSSDPILDLAARLDRPALTRAAHTFLWAWEALCADAEHYLDPQAPPPGQDREAAMPPGRDREAAMPPDRGAAGEAAAEPALMASAGGRILAQCSTPWGHLVVGGPGTNHYPPEVLAEIAFLIDLGGDDLYRGRAASAVGDLLRPLGALTDLGGDDLYDARGYDYALGGALLGIAVLQDHGGDDTYRGADGSLGAGFFGAGLLYDQGGNDLFTGGNFCQGAGACGFGALVSMAHPAAPPGREVEAARAVAAGLAKTPGTGALPVRYDENDSYRCARQAQGFGSTFGVGLLYDQAGGDTYSAGGRYRHAPLLPDDFQSLAQGFAIGFRPRAAGGIGILIDEEGNDFYDAEVCAQGVSYWYSLGLLFDGGGNDSYVATQYAQGAGVHLAVGSLWDRGGDDQYISQFGVTQGTAHDLSVGWLLDEGGDDYYLVSDGQGMSITNSAAIFIDVQGDDFYATPRGGQGKVTWARGFCGAALFLDLEGADTYTRDAAGSDGAVWQLDVNTLGIDLDRDLQLPDEVLPEIELTAQDSARAVPELFETASLWEVGSAREKVRRARQALIARGSAAVDYAVGEKLGTREGLEYRALRELARAHPDTFAARIIPLLDDADYEVQRNVIGLLGDLPWEPAREPLVAMLRSKASRRHWTRIIHALGRIGDHAAAPAIRPFLEDEGERRRIYSLAALASLADTTALPAIVARLDDPLLTVRAAASAALTVLPTPAVAPLCGLLEAGPTHPAIGLRTLGKIAVALRDSTARGDLVARGMARRVLMNVLERLDAESRPAARAAAVRALMELGDAETSAFVRLSMEDEYDPLVLRTYALACAQRGATPE
ncbi:MAG: HEAT repeat domain-containing protein [Candidatus Eisenbacteria sp.]|nr:HEAT repeat domain-containing protein [Candidatus Eisenbacteria bacterium]